MMLRGKNGLNPLALLLALVMAVSASSAAELANNVRPETPGLGDPGALVELDISAGEEGAESISLVGRDARRQIVVTGNFATGQARDLTRTVTYTVEPAGVVSIDSTGLLTPAGDGSAHITATTSDGVTGQMPVHVERFGEQTPINFANQISPIFTKLSCNSGGCHGKASGQNGFKLSLLGFEPAEDYEYLVKEAQGRRLFPAAPERSLLLTKAVNATPHGGGQRLEVDSHEYRLLHRWIAQGMEYGNEDDPIVTAIEVFPKGRLMERHADQQLIVLARYSDGSFEDVTRSALYEPNDPEMAETSVTGLVTTTELSGDVAIMARYQGHVGVFRASIPLGVETPALPEPTNFIDEHIFAKLNALGIPPSAPCDDATFIRRVTVDLSGRLPTTEEAAAFMADGSLDKRDRWIDQLLASGDYADYFARKWSAVLRNKRENANFKHGTYAFHSWIRHSLYTNKPYDEFVGEIVGASGEVGQHPPVVWYREVKDASQQVEDTAQLFLGLRIQCARCHHHPFEKWSQDDYYHFQAFFSRVGRKPGDQANEERIYHKRGTAKAKNPRSGEQLSPAGLGDEVLELDPSSDPRQSLVAWMTDPENPFFAKALANRYWKHFFDRGLVDPEDDMRVTNPASNPELLNALATHFVESGFDLKELVRTICRSQTYQLSSEPNEYNLTDKQNYSRFYPRRLQAEVLLDAINQVTNSTTSFGGLPPGTRAVQLPDEGVNNYFLNVFGSPQSDTACECERSQEANLAQSLHLLNSSEVQGKLSSDSSHAALLAAKEDVPHTDRIAELYQRVYSRAPIEEELAIAVAHIDKTENKRQAYEDILWALVNTKEFLFNH